MMPSSHESSIMEDSQELGTHGSGINSSSTLVPIEAPVNDFSSFMMFVNDMFLQDEYYSNFNMTSDLPMSSIIGHGAQFDVKRLALQGGMAVRTSADHHTRLTNGDNIILKKPRLGNAGDPGRDSFVPHVIDGIVKELRIISHPPLRVHKNILDVYGLAWELDTTAKPSKVWPVLMVEYASFGNLQDCLENREPLLLTEKLDLIYDIAEALAALHRCNIVHADMKPDNVLVLQKPDGTMTAKLADFGSAIILAEEPGDFKELGGGTLGWRAPEWGSEVHLGSLINSDIYSCGLVLWTILLDGQSPWKHEIFESGTRPNIHNFEACKIRENELLDIACSQILSGYVEDEAAIVLPLLQEMLQNDPNKRSLRSLLARRHLDESLPNIVDPQPVLKEDGNRHAVHDGSKERKMFPDFSELLALPLPLQNELQNALKDISQKTDQPQWRRADACYSLAIFHIERIGTVRPIDPENPRGGFTGYEIDRDESLKWLKEAALLGSRKAQVVYSQTSEALGAPTTPKWLADATRDGSYTASEYLKRVDESIYAVSTSDLKSQYCGTGLRLPDEDIYRAIVKRDIDGSIRLLSGQMSQITADGDSILHCMAANGFVDGVIYLLTERSDQVQINARNAWNETALFQASRSGHAEMVEILLSANAEASICSTNGENPLHWLSSFDINEDELFAIASSLASAGAQIDQACTENKRLNQEFKDELISGTPLRRATGLNNIVAVKVLLKLGADPYDGGVDYHPPIVEACLAHQSEILELFLPPNYDVRHPGWYKQPLLRTRDILENVFAIIKRAKSMALASPSAWANMEMQGNAKSLLGYAVNPKMLHERMAIHGGQWKEQMRKTIDLILEKGEEDYLRVSFTNTSAILEAVLSGDVEIVSHLLSACPEVDPLLAYPRPNGYSFWLPIHGAIAQQNKPIFDLLLQAAGPSTPLSSPPGSGFYKWIESKALEAGGETIGTCPPGQQFSTVLHLCANATVDPHFAAAILDGVENPTKLLMTSGHFGEMALTAALSNHSLALAELLINYGADPEVGGRPGVRMGAMAAGIGLSWTDFIKSTMVNMTLEGGQSPLAWLLRLNNEASTIGIEWLLKRGANFIVDQATQLSAIHLAVQGGHRFNLDEETMEQCYFYPCNLKNLSLVLKHFSTQEQLDWKDGLLGYTAVHWAVFQRDEHALKMLKEKGASLGLESDKGVTPLQLLEMLREVPAPVQKLGRKAVEEYHRRMERLDKLLVD